MLRFPSKYAVFKRSRERTVYYLASQIMAWQDFEDNIRTHIEWRQQLALQFDEESKTTMQEDCIITMVEIDAQELVLQYDKCFERYLWMMLEYVFVQSQHKPALLISLSGIFAHWMNALFIQTPKVHCNYRRSYAKENAVWSTLPMKSKQGCWGPRTDNVFRWR